MTTPTDRLDALEREVTQLRRLVGLLTARTLGNYLGDAYEPLSRQVAVDLPAFHRELREEILRSDADGTPRCQFTGVNLKDVEAFVGSAGTLRDHLGSLWFVHDSHSERVRPGAWFRRNSDGSVELDRQFDPSRAYAVAAGEGRAS